MIQYKKNILPNGLTVITHEDHSSPLVAINILYNVGSKDEAPDLTGLTHLFEHLMFSGTTNVKDYDDPLQMAGGENNAFTNADITNFYIVLPSQNIEVGLWLEADRMSNLKLTKKALEVQKKVVIEEFKETCLNEPYGDAWHHLSDMAYDMHAYKVPTIGKDISHIEKVTIDDAISFYKKHYTPSNAIICISGNLSHEEGLSLIQKWFGHVDNPQQKNTLPKVIEPRATAQSKTIDAAVPSEALYIAFNMADRLDADFYTTDLLSDLLSSGRSSRFYQKLIKEKQLFSFIDAYVSGTTDAGLFVIDSRLADGVSMDQAYNAIWQELDALKQQPIPNDELEKIKNKAENNLLFGEMGILNKAMSLCYFENIGNIDLINTEVRIYDEIRAGQLQEMANRLFDKNHEIQLRYKPLTS